MRYTAGRLLYIGSAVDLVLIEKSIANIRELTDLHAIYHALNTADVSALLPFSGGVAQAAAQLLASSGRPVNCDRESWPAELEFAWAVLIMSGVEFSVDSSAPPRDSPIVRLATGDAVSRDMVSEFDDYYREVFALRGQSPSPPRALLHDAFDAEEPTAFDALDLLRMSS